MAGKAKGPQGEDGVIIEFHRVGNAVKVSAVDTATFLEVSLMAPVTASEREMTEAALRKLAWVQARNTKAAPKKKGPGPRKPGR